MILMKSLLTTIGTFFIYILGGFDIALKCLIISIVIDYLTGMMKSYKSSTINSNICFKGIFKKISMICLVALSVILDFLTGDTGMIRNLVIYYLVANEGLSIVENLGQMGIMIPNAIIEKLEQIKKG